RDTPKLHFTGAHGDGGIDLTIDRNDLAFVGELDVLDQKQAFRQSAQQREKLIHSVDDQSARQTAKDLIVDEAVRMGVIPEHARPVPAGCRDTHLVFEGVTGLNVDEYVVAVALWRHAHAVKVQVRRGACTSADRANIAGTIEPRGQVVAESDPQRIAQARSQ